MPANTQQNQQNQKKKSFQTKNDSGSFTWSTKVTAGTIEDIKDQLGVDFNAEFDLFDQDQKHNPCLRFMKQGFLIDMLWLVCEPQVTKQKLSMRDFLGMIDDEVLPLASDALMTGLFDFFSLTGIGQTLQAAYDEQLKMTQTASDQMTQMIQQTDRTAEVQEATKNLFSNGQSPQE